MFFYDNLTEIDSNTLNVKQKKKKEQALDAVVSFTERKLEENSTRINIFECLFFTYFITWEFFFMTPLLGQKNETLSKKIKLSYLNVFWDKLNLQIFKYCLKNFFCQQIFL